MVFGTYIPPAEKRRIARATLWTERITNPNGLKTSKRHPGSVNHFGFTNETIDHGASGAVALSTGTVGTETATATTVTAANSINGKIISGSPVVLSLYACGGRDSSTPPWLILPMPQIYQAKATGTIASGDSGTVNLHQNGVEVSGPVSVTAYFDWIAGSDAIESSHELYIQWFAHEKKWRIVGATCP